MSSVDVAGLRFWLATCPERLDGGPAGLSLDRSAGRRLAGADGPPAVVPLGCLTCGARHDAHEVDADTYQAAMAHPTARGVTLLGPPDRRTDLAEHAGGASR